MSASLGAVRNGQLFRFGVCIFKSAKWWKIIINIHKDFDGARQWYYALFWENLSWLNGHLKRDRLYWYRPHVEGRDARQLGCCSRFPIAPSFHCDYSILDVDVSQRAENPRVCLCQYVHHFCCCKLNRQGSGINGGRFNKMWAMDCWELMATCLLTRRACKISRITMVGERYSKLLYIESKWFLKNQERSKWKKFVNRDFTPVHLNIMIDFFFTNVTKRNLLQIKSFFYFS